MPRSIKALVNAKWTSCYKYRCEWDKIFRKGVKENDETADKEEELAEEEVRLEQAADLGDCAKTEDDHP